MDAGTEYVFGHIHQLLLARYDDVKDAMRQKDGWRFVFKPILLAKPRRTSIRHTDRGRYGATFRENRVRLMARDPKREQNLERLTCVFLICPMVNKTKRPTGFERRRDTCQAQVAYELMEADGTTERTFLITRLEDDMCKIDKVKNLNDSFAAKIDGGSWRRICVGIQSYPEDLIGDWRGEDGAWENEDVCYRYIKDVERMTVCS